MPLRKDVRRSAIIASMGRERIIAAIAVRLYLMQDAGRPLQDAYRLSNSLARDWSKR